MIYFRIPEQTGWPISQLKGSHNKKTLTLQWFVGVCSSTETGCNTKLAAEHLILYTLSQHQSSVQYTHVQSTSKTWQTTILTMYAVTISSRKQCVTQTIVPGFKRWDLWVLTLPPIRHLRYHDCHVTVSFLLVSIRPLPSKSLQPRT